MKPLTLSASMMCMDFMEAGRQLDILNGTVDWFHADFMDGQYCPNITLSEDFIAACLKRTKKPMEVHLMVSDPARWTQVFLKLPVKMISLHAETIQANAFRLIRQIQDSGKQVGIVLNPATPLDIIRYYADEMDLLTLMTVDVGYAGQKRVPQVTQKISEAHRLRRERQYRYEIQIDGCCNESTYGLYRGAGADRLVMGSGLFGLDRDLEKAAGQMRSQQAEAWREYE